MQRQIFIFFLHYARLCEYKKCQQNHNVLNPNKNVFLPIPSRQNINAYFVVRVKIYVRTHSLSHYYYIFCEHFILYIVRNKNIYFSIFNDGNTNSSSDIFSYKTFFMIFSRCKLQFTKPMRLCIDGICDVDQALYNKNGTFGSAKCVLFPCSRLGHPRLLISTTTAATNLTQYFQK